MRFLAIAAATAFIIASSAMGQDTTVPKRIGYRNGKPITQDTPPPNKKPPNVHEVREAAGYDPTTNSNPIATSYDLPICCGFPLLVLITSPIWLSLLAGWCAVLVANKGPTYLDLQNIKDLKEKARKGDLVAFQQWKEATGRVGSNDVEYSVFMMWW